VKLERPPTATAQVLQTSRLSIHNQM
jgi:hypothetical protein